MTISIIILVIGLIVYFAFENKLSEAGRIAFFCGLLAFLLQVGGKGIL